MHLLLFCTLTDKCTIISQIITILHVLILSCHPQVACNHYLAKLHKYFKCSCLQYNVKRLNCKLYYQQLHLKYLCNLANYGLQAPWGWHDSVETCGSVIICEIIVHLFVVVQKILTFFGPVTELVTPGLLSVTASVRWCLGDGEIRKERRLQPTQ